MNDYTPVAIEVTNTYGKTTVFRSKFQTCKELGIQMTSLQSFLKQPTVTRGRFKGFTFRTVN